MTGLLNRKTLKTLPLRSSSIRAEIKGFTARTTAVLTYYNDNRTEIEGLFLLPLDNAATIVEFEAIIEDRYISANIRDTSESQQKNVLYRTENSQDGYFNVSIGKISPWVIAEVQVTIVSEIYALILGDALRYTLPQAFSPKVVVSNDVTTSRSRRTVSTSTLGYCFNIEIEIEAPCLLYGVQSNTHPIQVDAPPLSQTGSKIVVSIPDNFEPNDEVFELLMFLCRPKEPYIVIEEAKRTSDEIEEGDRNPINSIMNNPILMLSYSPDIPSLTSDPCITAQQTGEFILIIDCSITEETDTIRESCILFLKSLPFNCFFNVILFGDDEFEPVYESSQSYTCTAVESALNFVMNLTFGMRSGKLQQPLRWLFQQEELEHKPKQIFIITGDHKDDNDDISLGKWYQSKNKDSLARCFIFHIGENHYQHHLETLATVTRGKYTMAMDDRLQKQMATCLLAAVQPAITDVNVSWILPDAYDVIYTPEKLPSVFLGERLNLYAILASKETCPDKPSESGNSIKEFWFDDTDDLFQDEYEKKALSQLALPNHDVTLYSPSKTTDVVKDKTDYDSEVFLTEEEVRHLSHGMTFPKRSSIDRVQKWRVSKFPQNQDIVSDFEDDSKSLPEKDYQQNLHAHTSTRKKSSYDGAESVGSSNSLGSNRSSSSHYYPFPGYPTRMSSCRSIEARSPHVPKMADELFSFQENSKLHSNKVSGSQVNLSDYSSDHHSSGGHHSNSGMRKESQARPRTRLTEALYAEKANTHLIDNSNETTIELMLENLVTEKRTKLNLWLREQEEMTQCSWPITDYEKRDYMDKQEWRDSGLGNRSSSDAHTSDPEEEINTNRRRFLDSQEIISQSANKENVVGSTREKEKLSRANSTQRRTSIATPSATAATENKTMQQPKPKVSHKMNNSSTTSSFQKRKSKARFIWNAMLEKVRNVGTVVTEKSGETTFKRATYTIPSDVAEAKTPVHVEGSLRASFRKHPETGLYDSADNSFKNEKTAANSSSSRLERKPETPSVRPRSQGEGGHTHQTRNRPIIENSRTISTTSMFEIGKSEIGDVENLHLLPSHALIYLSGQCGEHVFKRIIPFQLEVDAAGSSAITTTDTTVHQLAAKSIIHDLELQMEDDGLLEDHGKVYIKTLISEVSKAANVLSKYTTLVTTDDKLNQNKILSVMQQKDETSTKKHEDQTEKHSTSTSHLPLKRATHDIFTLLDSFTNYSKILYYMMPEGSWRLNDQLASILSIPANGLLESCPFKNILRDDGERGLKSTDSLYQNIWATALALAWLQTTCETYNKEWDIAATKSKYWLSKQALPAGFTLKDLSVIADNTLRTMKTWRAQNSASYWNNNRKQ